MVKLRKVPIQLGRPLSKLIQDGQEDTIKQVRRTAHLNILYVHLNYYNLAFI